MWLVVLITSVLAGVLVALFLGQQSKPTPENTQEIPVIETKKKKKKKIDMTANLAKKDSSKKKTSTNAEAKEAVSTNQFLKTVCRGHTKPVTDIAYSPCGSYIGSCSEDGSVKVWKLTQSSNRPIYSQINVKFDHATACAFSRDSKYLVIALSDSKELKFYGIKDKKSQDKPEMVEMSTFKSEHKDTIGSVHFGRDNKWLVTICNGQDTRVMFWTPKGKLIKQIDTKQLKNHCGVLSHDSRFLCVATQMAEVKIWECICDKETGMLEKVDVAMTLKKHTKGVQDISFGRPEFPAVSDGVATVSGGKWRYYDINIQHQIGEEPKLKLESDTMEAQAIAVAPMSGRLVAVALAGSLHFCDKKTGKAVEIIANAHKGGVTKMIWNKEGTLLATTGQDKAINLWSNPQI